MLRNEFDLFFLRACRNDLLLTFPGFACECVRIETRGLAAPTCSIWPTKQVFCCDIFRNLWSYKSAQKNESHCCSLVFESQSISEMYIGDSACLPLALIYRSQQTDSRALSSRSNLSHSVTLLLSHMPTQQRAYAHRQLSYRAGVSPYSINSTCARNRRLPSATFRRPYNSCRPFSGTFGFLLAKTCSFVSRKSRPRTTPFFPFYVLSYLDKHTTKALGRMGRWGARNVTVLPRA